MHGMSISVSVLALIPALALAPATASASTHASGNATEESHPAHTADELAVRMAFCINNPWCQEDKPWQLRVDELKAQLIKTDEARRYFDDKAAKMAHDIDGAVKEMQTQATIPAAAPNVPLS